jgi:ATP sulfurylase
VAFDRLALSLRIGGSLMRSVFRNGELPPQVVTKPMRRSEIALGLRYGR